MDNNTITIDQISNQITSAVNDYVERITASCKLFSGLERLAAKRLMTDDGLDAIKRLYECWQENGVEPDTADIALYALLDLTKHKTGMFDDVVDRIIGVFQCKLPEPSSDGDVNFAVAVIIAILFGPECKPKD